MSKYLGFIFTILLFFSETQASDLVFEEWPENHFVQANINKIVVNVGDEIYTRINTEHRIWLPDPHLNEPISAPKWTLSLKKTEDTPAFVLTKNKKLSIDIALRIFLTGPTISECSLVSKIVMLKILQQIIGLNNFDVLFKHYESIDPLLTSIYASDDENIVICRSFLKNEPKQEISLGSFYYFKNTDLYRKKHPTGKTSGENTIYIGNNEKGFRLYMGFGPFFDHPKTEAEIRENFYQQFCISMTRLDERAFELNNNCDQLMKKIHKFEKNKNNYMKLLNEQNQNIDSYYFSGKKIKEAFFEPTKENPKFFKLKKNIFNINIL